MRILPIQLIAIGTCKNTNQISGVWTSQPISPPMKADSVSFGRTAKNAEKLRELFKYGMVDIYTGQRLIDPEFLTSILQQKRFSGSIRSVVNMLENVKDCLHPVEREIFENIKKMSEHHPLYRLDDAIRKMASAAQKRLLNIQRPIFQELKELSVEMPEKQKAAFDELMEQTEKQLSNIPIPYKFSNKEFKYKLTRISDGIKQRKIHDEIKVLNRLKHMASALPYTPSGRNFTRRRPRLNLDKSMKQAEIIRRMNDFWERSCLSKDKELRDLFNDSKMQVLNIPTIIPFKRRSFIHALKAITDTLENRELAKEMEKVVCKLPTSQKEPSAFILKSSRNSSEKIGHDLLIGSKGTIEHIIPYSKSKDGGDNIENYAFTSDAMNTMRGNKSFAHWVRENPKTYEAAQKCADRLIEIQAKSDNKQYSFIRWYLTVFANKLKDASPEEKPIIINLSALRN